jgi:hypothetical protein
MNKFIACCIVASSILFVSSDPAAAQNPSAIDSLTMALRKSSRKDSVEIYRSLSIQWFGVENEVSLAYSKIAYRKALALGDSLLITRSLRLMGQVLRRADKVDSALIVLSAVVPIAKRRCFYDELIYAYQSLGGLNLFIGRYDRSLKFYN